MGLDRSPKKPLGKLFDAGIAALVLGAALSIVPGFFTAPPLGETTLLATRIGAWCAAAIGIALLALHFLGRGSAGEAAPSKHDPEWASQLPTDLLRRHPREFDHTETPPITRSMSDRQSRPDRPRNAKS
jgi:hypothetical protein